MCVRVHAAQTLFTALFFVTYLGRVLKRQQWLALVLLSAGVGLVQYQEAMAGVASAAAAGASGAVGMSAVTVGVLAVLASSLLSGFANVYFEKVRVRHAPQRAPPRVPPRAPP